MSCDQVAADLAELHSTAQHAATRSDVIRRLDLPGPCGPTAYGVVGECLVVRDREVTGELEQLRNALVESWEQVSDDLALTRADLLVTDAQASARFLAIGGTL